jgi:hypothetical protein
MGPYYTKCIARVNITGAKDRGRAADHAGRIVRNWLAAGNAANKLDTIDYLVDGPLFDLTFEGDGARVRGAAGGGCGGQCKCKD